MTQKCGGRILTEAETDELVYRAIALEEKKEVRRLGRDYEERQVKYLEMITPEKDMEAIVLKNQVSATNSLTQWEWVSMEAAMPDEERRTHKNLESWMADRAKAHGIKEEKPGEEAEDDDDDAEILAMMGDVEGGEGEDEDDDKDAGSPRDPKKGGKEEEEDIKVEKAKNWSAVDLVCKESKMTFRGSFTPIAFTNWLWYRCVRPKLEETKSKLDELDEEQTKAYGIDDVDDVLYEYLPKDAIPKKKDDKEDKKDKKDKKDDKKDKKDDKKDKKSSKDEEKDDKKGKEKDKKKKKDLVVLNATEKIQASNLVKNMIYGESGRGKTIVVGWVNQLGEKEVPVLTPWEFQIAHVMRGCMELEYQTKKKKEAPDLNRYYEMAQGLADSIAMLRKQYVHEFPKNSITADFLALNDCIALQNRYREGSVGGVKFDLLWYLQNGAHLLAGSNFAKRHRSTIFQPFKIQELIVDSILKPGPQLIFGIAPPGTGKTAVVAHLLNLFPAHSLVFCCAAMPVVLGVGRIANSLGLPYAFVKGRKITPSYSCGRGLGHHTDIPAEAGKLASQAIDSLRYAVVKGNLERKKKRLAEKKRKRGLHDLKRFPRMFLMCDTASCAWLLRQLDGNRTLLVVDEPPMGSDRYPEAPAENPLSCAMMQTMMTPMYKTLLMSATLPRVEALPTLVDSFLDRFLVPREKKSEHVHECFSTELDRGAVMCGPSGAVAFPHQLVGSAKDLSLLCKRLPTDPLVMKAYTERGLASLLQRWQLLEKEGKLLEGFKKRMVPPEVKFADLSELNHASIRSYAMEVLGCVAAEEDDTFAKNFCEHKDEGEKNLFPPFALNELMFSNAYAFPGLTLVSGDEPAKIMKNMSVRLQEVMPKMSSIDDNIKEQEANEAKASKFQDDDEVVDAPATKLKFSPELVIQSEAFIKKWCPSRPEGTHTIVRILPTVQEFMAIKNLPIDETWQMLALSGAGSFDPTLDNDQNTPVYSQWVHEAMTTNKLACVTAGKEFTWGANVPASTVVVTASFAETTSVAGMLQYVGRAARRGLTTHGQAIFERDEDLRRIFESPDGLSTEALTMERYAKWWLTKGKEW